jgi:hypothetical protein
VLVKIVWFSPIYLVELGEAMGLYYALSWAVDLHLDNMDFVPDSKNVVDYFQTCNSDITELGCIMIVCKKLFHIYFFKTLLSNLAADKPMKLVKP